MKKAFSFMLRILPALLLIFSLFLSALPFQASAEINSIDWFDSIHSLYQADFANAGAYVSFDRNACTWGYKRNDSSGYATFVGSTADIRTTNGVEIRPFGSSYLDLKEIPLGTIIHTGFQFETDIIYSSAIVDYFILLRYYDENGNQVAQERSGDLSFSFNNPESPTGVANVDFNFLLNGATDPETEVAYMPRYCSIEIYLFPSINQSIIGSFVDNSCFIEFDKTLKQLLSDDRMLELKNSVFFVLTEQSDEIFESGMYDWYSTTLGFFFPSYDVEFEKPDDLKGILEEQLAFVKDGLDHFGDSIEEANAFLTSALVSFSCVQWLFGIFIQHPFAKSLVTVVMVFAAFAAFFSLGLLSNSSNKATGKGKKSNPQTDSSQKRLSGKRSKK